MMRGTSPFLELDELRRERAQTFSDRLAKAAAEPFRVLTSIEDMRREAEKLKQEQQMREAQMRQGDERIGIEKQRYALDVDKLKAEREQLAAEQARQAALDKEARERNSRNDLAKSAATDRENALQDLQILAQGAAEYGLTDAEVLRASKTLPSLGALQGERQILDAVAVARAKKKAAANASALDWAQLQAQRDAAAAREKAAQGKGATPDPLELQKGTITDLQKDVISYGDAVAAGRRLKKLISTPEARGLIGRADNLLQALERMASVQGPQAARLRAETMRLFNDYKNKISGAAVSDKEKPDLTAVTPQLDDSFDAFEAKLDASIDDAVDRIGRKTDILRSGRLPDAAPPAADAGAGNVDSGRALADKLEAQGFSDEEIEKVLKARGFLK